MTNYIIRRIIQSVPLLLVISFAVFLLMRLIPGGPLAAYENNPDITPADLARLKKELGLDVPVHLQYVNWLTSVLGGDWGTSQVTRRPVLTEIKEKLVNTIYLQIPAFLLALLLAIPAGIISAIRQYSWFDHLITGITFMGRAVPVFWLGLILIIIFSVTFRNSSGGPLFPGGGMVTLGSPDTVGDRLWHLVLPLGMLTFVSLASHLRFTRSGMLDVLHQDYIRTAHAKGLRERLVVVRHGLKNAVIPLVTIIGLEIPGLFAGAVLTETIFSWPGMGRLFFNSIERGDYAVMMGILMMSASLIVLFGLITDIVYGFLDPRIRFN